jgi:pepF/M3 family oligoendopeptidase
MTNISLPHWNLSNIYPSLDSAEFTDSFQQSIAQIDALEALFTQYNIGLEPHRVVDHDVVKLVEQIITGFGELVERLSTLMAYIHGFISTDSRNSLAHARQSELQAQLVRVSLLETRMAAAVGTLDLDSLFRQSSVAEEYRYMLELMKKEATHLMSPALEELAAELHLTGLSAWANLYNTYTSQISVAFEQDGETQQLPITAIRNLAYSPDRELRKRGYEAELAAWRASAVPIAAALNSIKGETLLLTKRRQWDSPLASALNNNHIDQATLDAMLQAAHESFPDFRRYLQAKAKAIGVEKLAWYDLFAPVGQSEQVWSYDQAESFIIEQFGTFSPKMRSLAERAFSQNWIDAEPRAGKIGGAFCMGVRDDESRILANYEPSFNSVSTLAHELGHAYHNLNLAQVPILQRSTPMSLAETASIFCETIVVQAALTKANPQEQIAILESSLQNSCQVVVDITSRFLFEKRVFELRKDRELSIAEFEELMLDAQRQTYGDGLDEEQLHGFMWAAKGHYYRYSFYNYPYMFGLLFALGLYARYQSEPSSFTAVYDDLLASTGKFDAADLAQRFGIDIHSVDFWRSSLDVIRRDIVKFEQLIAND